MKKITLVKHKGLNLAEIFQSLDIKFAFVNKNGEQVSAPGKCRDFLGDCIWSKKYNEKAYIYGFTYNYSETPYDDCRLSLKFPSTEAMTNFLVNLPYLHEKEKKAGVKRSVVYETQEKDTLVIAGSNWWINAVWKISLYTFYIKVMSYKTPQDCGDPENKYVKKLTPEIEDQMLSKIKKKSKQVLKTDIYVAHNNSGFVSLINKKIYGI